MVEYIQKADLAKMKQTDVCTVDRESLADITTIQVNEKLPKEQRMADFLSQIKNPYCYRCKKVVVKVSFSDTEITLEECLERYLKVFSE